MILNSSFCIFSQNVKLYQSYLRYKSGKQLVTVRVKNYGQGDKGAKFFIKHLLCCLYLIRFVTKVPFVINIKLFNCINIIILNLKFKKMIHFNLHNFSADFMLLCLNQYISLGQKANVLKQSLKWCDKNCMKML